VSQVAGLSETSITKQQIFDSFNLNIIFNFLSVTSTVPGLASTPIGSSGNFTMQTAPQKAVKGFSIFYTPLSGQNMGLAVLIGTSSTSTVTIKYGALIEATSLIGSINDLIINFSVNFTDGSSSLMSLNTSISHSDISTDETPTSGLKMTLDKIHSLLRAHSKILAATQLGGKRKQKRTRKNRH